MIVIDSKRNAQIDWHMYLITNYKKRPGYQLCEYQTCHLFYCHNTMSWRGAYELAVQCMRLRKPKKYNIPLEEYL